MDQWDDEEMKYTSRRMHAFQKAYRDEEEEKEEE